MTSVSTQELDVMRNRLAAMDVKDVADRTGAVVKDRRLEIAFFHQRYSIDASGGVTDQQHTAASGAIAYVVYRYALYAPRTTPPPGRRVSFRELGDAGPLAVHFANNTHKTIAQHFARRPEALRAAAERLGGRPITQNHVYDVFMHLQALPRVALYLQFNAADEEFLAQCSLAFDRSAERYLDSKAIFILGTYLTGGLIAPTCSTGDG